MKIVFACCDPIYLKEHGEAFAKSAIKNGETPWIHILCDEETKQEILNQNSFDWHIGCHFSFSDIEPKDRMMYACSRFIVATDIIRQDNVSEMLIVDIDGFLRKPIDWDDFKNCDYSIFTRDPLPGTVGWENEGTHVAAGAMYLRKSGYSFIDTVAHNLMENIKKHGCIWFMDQVILWKVHQNIKNLKFVQMPSKYIDWEFNEDSIIWSGKGNRKNQKNYLEERKSAS
jgi:hypothetical protein